MNPRTLVYLACAFVSGYAAARFVDEHQPPTGDNSMPEQDPRLATAVDRVTSAFAAECRRIASALANANSHTNQIDIDPDIARLNKLADLMDGTNETNILTYADNPAVISTPVSPSPGDPLAAGQPVNTSGNTASASPTGQATNTGENANPPVSNPQVGVSDSDNPQSPLSPSPLGTPQPIIQGTGAPTDAVVTDNAGINAANNPAQPGNTGVAGNTGGNPAPNADSEANPTGDIASPDSTTGNSPTASPTPEGDSSLGSTPRG